MPRDTGLRPTPEIAEHSHYAREILGSVPLDGALGHHRWAAWTRKSWRCMRKA